MQLTRAADYAVRAAIYLAGLPPKERTSHLDLAKAVECPEQFLSKVLQHLTRAGLVISHRGKAGGFEMPESRRGATVLDVVEAIEGPLRLNLCLESPHACGRQHWCPAHAVWAEGQAALVKVLKAATIGDLARKMTTTPTPESRLDGVPVWS